MSGKLHTSCILYIAKRHPFGCPKCLWLKPYPPNLFLARERICDYASAARRILETIRQRFRRPAAPRPKTQVPVSAEPNGNLIVELVHRASATAKASSAASRRFIFALKLSSTPSPPLQRLMESVYPSMSVPSLHEPLPVTLMQPETVGEQGFPFFRRDCLSHCQAYFPPSAPFWLTNNKYSRPSNHKHGKP